MTHAEVGGLAEVVRLRYLPGPSGRDSRWLGAATEISRRCPPSPRAYSVGAVIVDSGGEVVAPGYSRERDAGHHAEEVALRKASAEPGAARRLAGATMYTSLQPCRVRASRPRTGTGPILAAGIRRGVFARREA